MRGMRVKNTRRYFVIFTSFTVLFLIYLAIASFMPGLPEKTLLNSFNSSGAYVVSTEVYSWGKVDASGVDSLDKLKKLALEFSDDLGIARNEGFSSRSVKNDMIQEIELTGSIPVGENAKGWIVTVRSQLVDNGKNLKEGFISVDAVQDLSTEGLIQMRRDLDRVFSKHGIKPKVNTCITGSVDGSMDYRRMNDMSRLIFSGANARKVEGIRDRNLISVSAYTPFIWNYIKVKSNKINLSLAIRYNSVEDKTYVWLATPALTTEY